MNADRDQRDKCKAAVQTADAGACPADANCYYTTIDEVVDVNSPKDYVKTRQYASYPAKYLYLGVGGYAQDLPKVASFVSQGVTITSATKATWSQQDCIDACQATTGCHAIAWRQTG